MSDDLLVYPVETCDGRVLLRICRRKTESPEADFAPIRLDHGVLDIEPDFEALQQIHMACTRALVAKVRQFS